MSKFIPGIGQALMVVEGAPVAFEEGSRAFEIYMKGHRKAKKLAKEGKRAESIKTLWQAQMAAQAAAVRGAGKTAMAAVTAQEAAESMMPSRRNPRWGGRDRDVPKEEVLVRLGLPLAPAHIQQQFNPAWQLDWADQYNNVYVLPNGLFVRWDEDAGLPGQPLGERFVVFDEHNLRGIDFIDPYKSGFTLRIKQAGKKMRNNPGTRHFVERVAERGKELSARNQKKLEVVYTALKSQRAKTAGLHGRYAVQFGGPPGGRGNYIVVHITGGNVTGFISLLVDQKVLMPETTIVSAKSLGIDLKAKPRRRHLKLLKNPGKLDRAWWDAQQAEGKSKIWLHGYLIEVLDYGHRVDVDPMLESWAYRNRESVKMSIAGSPQVQEHLSGRDAARVDRLRRQKAARNPAMQPYTVIYTSRYYGRRPEKWRLTVRAASEEEAWREAKKQLTSGEKIQSVQPAMSRANPMMNEGPLYQDVLAHLRAIQWVSWTAHWTAAGPSYYGDHKLLQRLYAGKGGGPDINEEIDALGERMVAYFGAPSVNPSAIVHRVHQLTQQALSNSATPFDALLSLEMQLQQAIRRAWKANQASGKHMSLGIDDLLMSLANEREGAIYLLRRRLGGRKPMAGHQAPPRIPPELRTVTPRVELDDSLTPKPLPKLPVRQPIKPSRLVANPRRNLMYTRRNAGRKKKRAALKDELRSMGVPEEHLDRKSCRQLEAMLGQKVLPRAADL